MTQQPQQSQQQYTHYLVIRTSLPTMMSKRALTAKVKRTLRSTPFLITDSYGGLWRIWVNEQGAVDLLRDRITQRYTGVELIAVDAPYDQ